MNTDEFSFEPLVEMSEGITNIWILFLSTQNLNIFSFSQKTPQNKPL